MAGDELFGGYRRYIWHQRGEAIRKRIPAGLRRMIFGTLAVAYPKIRMGAALDAGQDVLQGTRNGPRQRPIAIASPCCRRRCASIFIPTLFSRGSEWLQCSGATADTYERVRQRRPAPSAQYADMKMWLPGDILVKVDRTSMAVSLEVRAPLLDYQLVEWSARLPSAQRNSWRSRKKHILKCALEPFVPSELLYRRKQGFSAPMATWFRGPLVEQMDRAAVKSGAFGLFQRRANFRIDPPASFGTLGSRCGPLVAPDAR